MAQRMTVVSEHPFFEDISPEHLEQIADHAKVIHFHTGDMIFREGDDADRFYLLLEGTVALELHTPEQGVTPIQMLHKHDLLGWSWLFEPYRWLYDARAVEPTKTLAFDGEHIRMLCETNHELGYELMKRFTNIVIERLQKVRRETLALDVV